MRSATLRQARPIASSVSDAGLGTVCVCAGPICSVKLSASAPDPHVQTKVPGVTPRLAKVAPENVVRSETEVSDTYPFGK